MGCEVKGRWKKKEIDMLLCHVPELRLTGGWVHFVTEFGDGIDPKVNETVSLQVLVDLNNKTSITYGVGVMVIWWGLRRVRGWGIGLR